jgi:tRNA(adenine34) deaminase
MENIDEKFMREALGEAAIGFMSGEVPIGAVAVYEGDIVARGHNRRRALKDITAHAEMMCLRDLSPSLEKLDLSGYTIYSTLEPCSMCAGAMIHYHVSRVVFGAKDLKLGAAGSAYDFLRDAGIEVVGGVLDEDCREILYKFFKKELGRESKKWEDIELE